MAIELNHTIVHAENKEISARWLADLLNLPPPVPFGPFMVVKTANGVSLDFINSSEPIASRHFAFFVSDAEFDQIFARIKECGMRFWADPMGKVEGQINTYSGGRGCYFRDPSGHWLEILTRPYEM